MIHHFSMPADDTKLVADTLADIFEGTITDFSPTENAFMVWFGDEHGSAIEVYPSNVQLTPGTDETPCIFNKERNAQYSTVHVAISVPCEKEKLISLGESLGWRTKEFRRGSFRVVEFWVENKIMLELLPADMAAEYLKLAEKYSKN